MINILIVDDNEIRLSKIRKKILELDNSKFCIIDEASYSNEAEELLKLKQYDLIILDVVLPKKNKDIASPKVGLNLLKRMNKSAHGILLPRKIIGITGYINDISEFKEDFDSYTSNILEANISSQKWLSSIVNYIDSLINSLITSDSLSTDKLLLSFHGIRTFGLWQDKLEELVKRKANNFAFEQLKYNYFTLFFFFIPYIRKRVIKELKKDFERILSQNSDKKIYIVSHSFGTYVAVKLLEKTSMNMKIETLVLSGSVLPDNYNLSTILDKNVNKIINDCARNDFILILCKLFIPSFSDAGRIGFIGRTNNESEMLNRFYRGGHSVYFENSDLSNNIMNKYWVPILVNDNYIPQKPEEIEKPEFLADFTETFITLISKIKNLLYILIIFYILYKSFL
ncbi:MAG: response regulator [Arcobacteraceae bacterium]